MNKCLLLVLLVGVVATTILDAAENVNNSTVHFFLLMIPESKIEGLKRRAARQEEGALGAIAEAVGPAANVGQILQGVLGGDLRPIFAGSTAFIPEGDFREGVTEVLQQTVAPAIQRILMEFNKNVQRHFNMTTTPMPAQLQQQQPTQQLNQNNNIGNNQFQQQQPQQNFNNFNQQQQQVGQFQPSFNQFQQLPNQQLGGGVGGVGAIGGVGGGAGVGNFNNAQYNQLQNYQQNQVFQQQQGYPNQLQQSQNFPNNQFPSTNNNNFQPNYNNNNQYQQPAGISNPLQQVQLQNSQPPFAGQFQAPNKRPSPIINTNVVSPPHQSTFNQKFQPPPQNFPLPPNSNQLNSQQFVPRLSYSSEKIYK